MITFKWKRWRFAWLAYQQWGVPKTVYDISGKWEKLLGHLCFLVEPRHDA